MSKLSEIISQFKDKKIAVIGDISLDVYTFGEVRRINPEKPAAPLLKKIREEYRLGCAANVAANLSAINAETILYSVSGEDRAGSEIFRLCREKKIEAFMPSDGETIVKERLIEIEHNDYLARVDSGETNLNPISQDSIDQIMTNLYAFRPRDAIILSDYNKRVFGSNLAEKVIKYANEFAIPLVADIKPKNYNKFLNSTVIAPNLEEAEQMAGPRSTLEELAFRLKEKMKSKYLVITLGKDGMLTYDGSYHKMPTQAREVVDVVGAGDTVTALLALSLASEASIVEAAQIANVAAGIVVEKQGTATVTKEEILERINL